MRFSDRFRRSLIVALIVVAWGACRSTVAFEVDVSYVANRTWGGFGTDFSPAWSGATKKVDWVLENRPSYGSNVMIWNSLGYGQLDYQPYVYKPIELLHSSRGVTADAVASVDQVTASSDFGPSKSGAGEWRETGARFAEVTDAVGTLLATGEAIGEQQSSLSDVAASVQGRINSRALVQSSLLGRADASAVGESSFSAQYAVREQASFFLGGVLAGVGLVDLSVKLTNQVGDVVFELSPTSGSQGKAWEFEVSGQLSPGTYDLSLSALADSLVERSRSIDLGGSGEFQFDFSATPLTEKSPFVGWIPAPPPIVIELDASGLKPADIQLEYAGNLVPEPASASLALASVVSLLVWRRGANRRIR